MALRSMSRLATLALVAVLAAASASSAGVITQWNFNSVPPDNDLTTGTTNPSVGVGTITTIGGVTSTFASGFANGGSSDPATVDNTGLQTTNYTAQGTGNKTAGIQVNVSTVGFFDIIVSYDLRHSNTSSRFEQVQYTINGSTYIDAPGGVFDGNAGDTWFNGRTVNLSGISGVNNNPNFGIRVVSLFAPGTSEYAPSNPNSNYAATGTWRFDMVTIRGTVIPEPSSVILSGLGLAGALGVTILRRRRAA